MLKKILKIILKTYFLQFDISQFFGLIWKKKPLLLLLLFCKNSYFFSNLYVNIWNNKMYLCKKKKWVNLKKKCEDNLTF